MLLLNNNFFLLTYFVVGFPTVTESILRIQPEDVMTTRIFTDSDDHINTPLHVT